MCAPCTCCVNYKKYMYSLTVNLITLGTEMRVKHSRICAAPLASVPSSMAFHDPFQESFVAVLCGDPFPVTYQQDLNHNQSVVDGHTRM